MSRPPFVGRTKELETVAMALCQPPALVVVEASAGMGKSRLIAEALEQANPPRVLSGVCAPVEDPPPLGPLIDALRDVRPPPHANLSWALDALRPLLPELGTRDHEPRFEATPAEVGHLRRRAIRALLGSGPPTVCVLEDLQWCHRSTVDALTFLCGNLPESVCLVATFRRDAIRQGSGLLALAARCGPNVPVVRLDLGPLTAGDVRELASISLDGVEIAEPAVRALHERSGGNPLAIVELVRRLAGALARDGAPSVLVREAVDTLELPPAVRDLELDALAHLPADARKLAEAAAVFATATSIDDLAAVSGLTAPRAAAAFRDATRGGVVRETDDGRCVMRTPLVSESVLAGIPRAERAALHRQAARRIAASADPPQELLARHYREAGMVTEWIAAAEAAAAVAEREYRFDEAARLLGEVALLPSLTPRIRRRLALSLSHVVPGGSTSPADAIAVIRRCLTEKPPAAERALLRHKLGDMLVRAGAISEGRRELERAVAEAEPESDLHVHGLATLANPWGPGGDLDEHMAWMREAAALAAKDVDNLGTISVRALECQLLLCAGDRSAWDAVRAIPWTATGAAARRDLMWAASSLVDPCYHLGRYDRARQFLADTVERARDLGNAGHVDVLEASALALDWATGSWNGLAPRVRAAAEALAGRPEVTTRLRRIGGLLAAAAGQSERAERELRHALAEAQAVGTVPGIAGACAGIARLDLAAGDASAACEEALRGVATVRAKGIWAWAGEVALPAVEALVACGRRAEAKELVAAMAAGLRGRDTPLARAALWACRGHLAEADGSHADAVRHFALAERAYASMPRPHDAALMATRRGAALLRSGDDAGARPLYDALNALRTLDASRDVAQVRRILRRFQLPVPTEGRRGRIGYGSALSPRQREIAEMAAQGLTNPQISARLALSPRTVENHLSLALAKLGVRSRTELARKWAQTAIN